MRCLTGALFGTACRSSLTFVTPTGTSCAWTWPVPYPNPSAHCLRMLPSESICQNVCLAQELSSVQCHEAICLNDGGQGVQFLKARTPPPLCAHLLLYTCRTRLCALADFGLSCMFPAAFGQLTRLEALALGLNTLQARCLLYTAMVETAFCANEPAPGRPSRSVCSFTSNEKIFCLRATFQRLWHPWLRCLGSHTWTCRQTVCRGPWAAPSAPWPMPGWRPPTSATTRSTDPCPHACSQTVRN